jgi:hypothetical protein
LRNFQTCCIVDLHYTTKPNQENIEQELWIMIRNKRCYLVIWKPRTDWNLTRDRWSCGIEKFCNSTYGRWLLTTHNSSDHDGGSTPSLLELRLCFGESSFLPNSLENRMCVDGWFCGWLMWMKLVCGWCLWMMMSLTNLFLDDVCGFYLDDFR